MVFSTLKSQGVKRTGERDRQEIFGESQVRRTSTGTRKGERDKRDFQGTEMGKYSLLKRLGKFIFRTTEK